VQARADEVWLLDHGEILGGGQRFGLRLAEALDAAGWDVVVACDPGSPLAARCRDAGIRLAGMRFPAPVPWNPAVVPALVRTRRLLSALDRGSMVIGNHPRAHAYLFAARSRPGAPAIVNVAHEQESAARATARFAYRRSGALVAIGSNAAAEYERRLPGVGVTKVNNFLPVEYFERAAGRRKPPRATGAMSLGVLARLIPEKGVVELVDELAAPATRSLWSRALIGGAPQDATYTARVEERIAKRGLGDRIRLVGDVEDVPGFLGSVDALVVPSTGHEAQPTVIVEAVAHGVAVVVREPAFSLDFDGLPIVLYRDAVDLGAALHALPSAQAPVDELTARFGPGQAVAGIEAAAQLARARS
jgi:glycosyltransferase involved in cell wall biosynthesis